MWKKLSIRTWSCCNELVFLLTANAFSHWSEPHRYSHKRIQNIQCCGSGMFTPDPNFFHSGWRIQIFSIRIRIKNVSILTQTIVPMLSEIWSGLFIPDSDFLLIPDPGAKRQHCIYRWMNISGVTPVGWPTWTWPGIHHQQSINAPEQPSRIRYVRQFYKKI